MPRMGLPRSFSWQPCSRSVLRWQRGGAYILREIEWHDIASVQIAGEQLEPDELRAMVQQVRRDLPPGQPQAVPKTVEIRALWPADQPGATPSEHRVPAASQQPSPRRVRWPRPR